MKLTMGIERLLVVDEPDFKLFHGDSFKIVPNIQDTFPLIFCDPPFFDWLSGSKGDSKPDPNMLSHEIYRKVQLDGCLWLCGTQPQLANDWHYWHRFFTILFELIQAKNAGAPSTNLKKQLMRVHENIWCLYRSADNINNLRITTERVTKKGTEHMFAGGMKIWGGSSKTKKKWRVGVGYPRSVYYGQRVDKNSPEYVGHPTQKPEELIELIIKMSTEEGDWILDPFCGSGTVPTVAKRLKRKCVAIEIDDNYVEMIKNRVKNESAKTKMPSFVDETISNEDYEKLQQKDIKPKGGKITDWVGEK